MASQVSVSGESDKCTSEQSESCSFYTFESDESELEESRGPDAGAIEPYMYEPVTSESEEIDESDQDAEEERRYNTDWYRLNNCMHTLLH